MSSDTGNPTVNTIAAAFKLAELGLAYLEKRQQRRIAITDAGVVDTIDEALREFEGLDVPKAYAIADDEPLLIPPKHEPESEEPV